MNEREEALVDGSKERFSLVQLHQGGIISGGLGEYSLADGIPSRRRVDAICEGLY
jgi:hypothetical protein